MVWGSSRGFFGVLVLVALSGQEFSDRLGSGYPVSAQFRSPDVSPVDQKAKVAC